MKTITQIEMTPDDLAQMISDQLQQAISEGKNLERNAVFDAVEYFTANQAADILGMSVKTLRQKTIDGIIRAEVRQVREKYSRSELLKYMAARDDASAPFT